LHEADKFFEQTGFDYERIQAGLRHIAQQLDDDTEPLNEALSWAWIQQDRETALECLQKLEDRPEPWAPSIWIHESHFHQAKRWTQTPPRPE
jgi:hypothetical protein